MIGQIREGIVAVVSRCIGLLGDRDQDVGSTLYIYAEEEAVAGVIPHGHRVMELGTRHSKPGLIVALKLSSPIPTIDRDSPFDRLEVVINAASSTGIWFGLTQR